jgi:hypothetical protein
LATLVAIPELHRHPGSQVRPLEHLLQSGEIPSELPRRRRFEERFGQLEQATGLPATREGHARPFRRVAHLRGVALPDLRPLPELDADAEAALAARLRGVKDADVAEALAGLGRAVLAEASRTRK